MGNQQTVVKQKCSSWCSQRAGFMLSSSSQKNIKYKSNHKKRTNKHNTLKHTCSQRAGFMLSSSSQKDIKYKSNHKKRTNKHNTLKHTRIHTNGANVLIDAAYYNHTDNNITRWLTETRYMPRSPYAHTHTICTHKRKCSHTYWKRTMRRSLHHISTRWLFFFMLTM